jgi:hypothetical protein
LESTSMAMVRVRRSAPPKLGSSRVGSLVRVRRPDKILQI